MSENSLEKRYESMTRNLSRLFKWRKMQRRPWDFEYTSSQVQPDASTGRHVVLLLLAPLLGRSAFFPHCLHCFLFAAKSARAVSIFFCLFAPASTACLSLARRSASLGPAVSALPP